MRGAASSAMTNEPVDCPLVSSASGVASSRMSVSTSRRPAFDATTKRVYCARDFTT